MPGMFSRRGIVPIEAAAPPTPVAVVVVCFGAFFFAAAFFTAFFFTGFFPRSFFFAGFFFAAFLFAAFFFAFLAISQPINAVLIYTSDDCRRVLWCQADSERTAAPRTAQTTQHRLSFCQSHHMRIPAGCLGDRKSTRLNSSHLGISYAV